jgi:hypothetical protein
MPPAYLVVLAEIISSTLKMEAICSSESSVDTQQTTWRHIPEDDTLQMPYSLEKARRFGGAHHVHLQSQMYAKQETTRSR